MNFHRFIDRDISTSAAELALACKLAETGITQEISLRFETQKQFCLQSTTPDFFFADVNLAVYLDGEQVHKNRETKDRELRDKLAKRYGCTVRSYSYHAPITKKRLQEIVDQIVDDVQGLRRLKH